MAFQKKNSDDDQDPHFSGKSAGFGGSHEVGPMTEEAKNPQGMSQLQTLKVKLKAQKQESLEIELKISSLTDSYDDEELRMSLEFQRDMLLPLIASTLTDIGNLERRQEAGELLESTNQGPADVSFPEPGQEEQKKGDLQELPEEPGKPDPVGSLDFMQTPSSRTQVMPESVVLPESISPQPPRLEPDPALTVEEEVIELEDDDEEFEELVEEVTLDEALDEDMVENVPATELPGPHPSAPKVPAPPSVKRVQQPSPPKKAARKKLGGDAIWEARAALARGKGVKERELQHKRYRHPQAAVPSAEVRRQEERQRRLKAEELKSATVLSFKKCNKCAAVIPANFKICGRCGTRLRNICPGCGSNVPRGVELCSSCGKRIMF